MSIEAMKKALEAAYLAGFYRSGEGYNSDYPFSNKGLDPLDDPYWIESRDAYVRTAIEQAEKQSGNVTFVTLAGKLMDLGLVQADAILDPDGYDGGVQWKAIEKLLRFVKGEEHER
jgi:hypothetical protein